MYNREALRYALVMRSKTHGPDNRLQINELDLDILSLPRADAQGREAAEASPPPCSDSETGEGDHQKGDGGGAPQGGLGVAIARKTSCKALKTWNPRPGFRRVDRRSSVAVTPVGGNRIETPRPTHSALVLIPGRAPLIMMRFVSWRPGLGVVIARKIGRKTLKTWNPRPGFRGLDGRSSPTLVAVGGYPRYAMADPFGPGPDPGACPADHDEILVAAPRLGRCDRPENRPQALENMESAPGNVRSVVARRFEGRRRRCSETQAPMLSRIAMPPKPVERRASFDALRRLAMTARSRTGSAPIRSLGVAIARKIRRKALETLNPRPGSRRIDRRSSLAVAPVGGDRLGSNTGSGVAIARKTRRKALKTLNPRPGFRRIDRRSSLALAPVGGDRLGSNAGSGVAIARKTRRKALETLNPRPGFRRVGRKSSRALASVGGDRLGSNAGSGVAIARKTRRKALETLNPRPGFRRVGRKSSRALASVGGDRLGSNAGLGVAIARKIGRKVLETLNPRPGFRRVDRRSSPVLAPVGGDRPVTRRPGARCPSSRGDRGTTRRSGGTEGARRPAGSLRLRPVPRGPSGDSPSCECRTPAPFRRGACRDNPDADQGSWSQEAP